MKRSQAQEDSVRKAARVSGERRKAAATARRNKPRYVIISGEPSTQWTMQPTLATGPFDDAAAAQEFRDLLARLTTGRHLILSLHTPDVHKPPARVSHSEGLGDSL